MQNATDHGRYNIVRESENPYSRHKTPSRQVLPDFPLKQSEHHENSPCTLMQAAQYPRLLIDSEVRSRQSELHPGRCHTPQGKVMPLLSFVIPCYRSELTIEQVVAEIADVMNQAPEWNYEIIAVDDCSPDGVLQVLRQLAIRNSRLRVLSLARNVGKHSALLAGYAIAKGHFVIDLDDDLQCPTPELWRLLAPLQNSDADYVTARYRQRTHAWWKKLGSNLNLFLSGLLLDKPAGFRFENFNAMRGFVAQQISCSHNPFAYMEGLVLQVTTRVTSVEMTPRSRGDDRTTGYTLARSAELLLNGITAFSIKPLRTASFLGLVTTIAACVLLIRALLTEPDNTQVPSDLPLILAVILCSNGLIMLLLGMMGEYVGRSYLCLHNSRPYTVRESINAELPDPLRR